MRIQASTGKNIRTKRGNENLTQYILKVTYADSLAMIIQGTRMSSNEQSGHYFRFTFIYTQSNPFQSPQLNIASRSREQRTLPLSVFSNFQLNHVCSTAIQTWLNTENYHLKKSVCIKSLEMRSVGHRSLGLSLLSSSFAVLTHIFK